MLAAGGTLTTVWNPCRRQLPRGKNYNIMQTRKKILRSVPERILQWSLRYSGCLQHSFGKQLGPWLLQTFLQFFASVSKPNARKCVYGWLPKATSPSPSSRSSRSSRSSGSSGSSGPWSWWSSSAASASASALSWSTEARCGWSDSAVPHPHPGREAEPWTKVCQLDCGGSVSSLIPGYQLQPFGPLNRQGWLEDMFQDPPWVFFSV